MVRIILDSWILVSALCYILSSAADVLGTTNRPVLPQVGYQAAGVACQASFDANHVELKGRLAILSLGHQITASTETLLEHQLETLYACNFLRMAKGNDLVVTITSDAQAAKLALESVAQRHLVLIINISPWPGNQAKILGSAKFLQSLMRVGRSHSNPNASIGSAQTRVLLTDCCDVLFRNDDWCSGSGTAAGGGDLFKRFAKLTKQHGWRVVFSAERGTSMLASNEDYMARLHAAPPVAARPPRGWLVPVWRRRGHKLRQARFSHAPSELPPNPLLLAKGTPDVCTEVDRVCIHHKSVNSGLVIGELEALANLYSKVLRVCGDGCSSNNPAAAASDQNILAHYLLTSHFCQGQCSLDYNFTLFHTVQLWGSRDYLVKNDVYVLGTHGKVPRLYIRLPIAKHSDNSSTIPKVLSYSQNQAVLISSDWIALSPSVYKEAWFSVPACAFHAAGSAKFPRGAPNLDLIRSGLDLHAPLRTFSFVQGQSAVVTADGNVLALRKRHALIRSANRHNSQS